MSAGGFSPAALAAYRRDGFLVLPGVLDPAEVTALRHWTDKLQAWPEVPGRYRA